MAAARCVPRVMSVSSRAAFAARMPTASVAYRISEFPGEGRAAPSRIISRFTLKFASAEIMRAAMTATSRGVPSATSVKSAAADEDAAGHFLCGFAAAGGVGGAICRGGGVFGESV